MSTLSVNMSSPTSTSYISANLLTQGSYGFSYGSRTSGTTLSGWLPGNYNISNSAAVGRFYFTIPFNWSGVSITVTYYQNSEINYDYGFAGTLDTAMSTSYSDITTGVKTSFKGKGSNSAGSWGSSYTETYSNVSAGAHYFDLKYRKDGSVNTGADACIITSIVFTYTSNMTNNTEYVHNSITKGNGIHEYYPTGNQHWFN